MDVQDKIKALQKMKPEVLHCAGVTRALLNIDSFKRDYRDYLVDKNAINWDLEKERIDTADYDTLCAILTMLIREANYCGERRFEKHIANGDIQNIIDKMIERLQEQK